MRIAILTAGSTGDVQPYVALGRGLQLAGHRVRMATFRQYKEFAASRGLDFAPVTDPTTRLATNPDWLRWQTSEANPAGYVYYLSRVVRTVNTHLKEMFDDYWNACQGADVVIGSSASLIGPHIADTLGVPYFWALLQPMGRTRAFPHFLSPSAVHLGGVLNRMTYIIAERVFWHVFRPSINRWRRETLGVPPLWQPGPYGLLGRTDRPVLYGFSPSILSAPSDWRERSHVTGFWFLERTPAWRPPDDLVRFLSSGPPPIYVGLGRLLVSSTKPLLDLSLRALARTGHRALLMLSGSEVTQRDLPAWAFRIDATPHDWLFPQVAAVVHHGGVGTVAAACQAGVPSVGVPVFFDQSFWSRRIAALGIGSPPIPRAKLSLPRLSDAITLVTEDRGIRARAARLGSRIRAENGVERAVAHVNRYLAVF